MRRGTLAERIYRLLLRVYPAEFRHACGDELVADFRRDMARRRYRGGRGKLRFWRHTLTDWARTAWTERRATGDRPRRTTPRPVSLGAPPPPGRGASMLPYRQAARGLLRDPAYTVVAAITLAVGMSATTVVFALVNGLLLTPLPLPEPDRLVQVEERERDSPAARMAAYANWLDVAAEIDAFEELALFAWDTKTLTGVDTAVRLRSREVSENFFRMLGVSPALGREFTGDEQVDGQRRAVILSHALWTDAFAADESILGRAVQLDATDYVVVGVMPAGFDFPSRADIWVPVVPPSSARMMRRAHRFRMTGRLAEAADLSQAREALDVLAERLEREFPETNEGNYFAAYPLLDEYVGEARPALRLLSGAVGVVLLIASVNIAGLALARSSARQREIAMRRALGASRKQLAGLVLCEGLVVGVCGGLLALPVAAAGLRGLLGLAGDVIPRSENASMTAGVFLFAGVVSLSASLLASLLPLAREAATGTAALVGDRVVGRPGFLGRRALVIAEVALAVILVAGAGLLGRSLSRLTSVSTGVDSAGILTMDVSLPNGKYPERADSARFFDELLPRLASLPGVERAAVTLTPPAYPFGWRNSLTIRERPVPENERPSVSYVVVSPGYFETLAIPVLAGRSFNAADNVEGARVLILNRTAAERFWPDASPIGALASLGNPEDDDSWMRVVGVVEDVRQSVFEPPIPEVYVPVVADRVLSFVLLARTRGIPEQAASAVRAAISDADPDIPVTGVMSLDERIGEQTTDMRLYTGLMSSFAAIALALASVGVYGVLSYSVSLRRREFGVRTAIGASRGRVMRLVLREALLIAAVAIAAGTAAAVSLGRLMASLLFEVRASDPTTLVGVATTVVTVTMLASLAPAWRAASSDPLGVLRAE